MAEARKARAVGFNHIALEVGDIEEALAFYGRLFDSNFGARATLRPSSIWATNSSPCKRVVLSPLTRAAILGWWSTTRMRSAKRWPKRDPTAAGSVSRFSRPVGQPHRDVGYDNVQFTKAPNVLRGMGLTHLSKNEKAIKELTNKGMAPNKKPISGSAWEEGEHPPPPLFKLPRVLLRRGTRHDLRPSVLLVPFGPPAAHVVPFGAIVVEQRFG